MIPNPRPRSSRPGIRGLALGLSLGLGLAAAGGCGPGGGDGPGEVASEAADRADAARLFGDAPAASAGSSDAARAPSGAAGESSSISGGSQRASPGRTAPPPDSVDVTDLGYNRGSPDAPIRVIEFSDFGCGYCRKFHLETFPTVAEEYIETGKVAWKYIPFVLGMFPNSVEATTAGECAGQQGRFGAMRDRLFRDQSEWRKAGEPHEVFERYALEAGLDVERFRSCVDEGRVSDRVRRSIQAARQVGVRGTPTFLINGLPVQGALPMPVFRDIFGRLLARDSVGGGH